MTSNTGQKRAGITPGRDVLPRYLQGAQYTNRVLRNKGGRGGSGGRGGQKTQQLASSVPTDRKGYTIGGWHGSGIRVA